MANWNNPTLTSTYTNFVTEVKDRDVEVALWFEGMSPTNLPTNAKRLNTSTGKFEKWNGTAWVDAASSFRFPAMVVDGNVGIGTASPGYKLDVSVATNTIAQQWQGAGTNFTLRLKSGDGATMNSSVYRLYMDYLNGTNTNGFIDFYRGGDGVTGFLAFGTAGSERMRLDSSGNLGIGTSSPGEKLQVAGAIRATGAVAANTTGGILAYQGSSTVMLGSWGADASTYGAIQFWQSNSTGTLFRTGMLLDSSGNLGIGTSSPTDKLDVQGNVRIGATKLISSSPSAGNYNLTFQTYSGGFYDRMVLDYAGNLGLGVTPTTRLDIAMPAGAGTPRARVDQLADNPYYELQRWTGTGSNYVGTRIRNIQGAIAFDQSNGAAIGSQTFTQAMTLDASGRLSVGTTAASARFHVQDTSPTDGTLLILDDQATTGRTGCRLKFQSNGVAHWSIGIPPDTDALQIRGWVGATQPEFLRVTSAGNLEASSSVTGHWQVPRGTTAQRPTGAAGMIRFNTSLAKYEGHNGTAWSSIGGGATGGGSDDIFYENGQTVTTNYTITTNKNAMSAGPITVASGITVTVPAGSTWVVV